MAMAVVLFPMKHDAAQPGPAALDRLADLGVTTVTLVGGGALAALVLEGWAFDPSRAEEAVCAVTGTRPASRTLRQQAQLVVTARPTAPGEVA